MRLEIHHGSTGDIDKVTLFVDVDVDDDVDIDDDVDVDDDDVDGDVGDYRGIAPYLRRWQLMSGHNGGKVMCEL